MTQQALKLDANLPEARSKLGIAMSEDVVARFWASHTPRNAANELANIARYGEQPVAPSLVPAMEAIQWLEEARKVGDDPEGCASAEFALMYGIINRYNKMLSAFKVAIGISAGLKGELQVARRLIALANTCGNDDQGDSVIR